MDSRPDADLPRVTLKWAQTLDGRIATATGDARWISGPESRAWAHLLRAQHDAILVGVGTVLADNPQLTVRDAPGRSPLRIVLDSHLRTPPAARLVSDGAPTLICTSAECADKRLGALERDGVEVVRAGAAESGVALEDVLRLLRERDVRSVLVEGGQRVLTSFLRLRLASSLAVFIAPTLLGAGLEAVGDLHATAIADAVRLENRRVEQLGDDLFLRADIVWPE